MKQHREREGRKEGGNSCKDIFVADWSKGMCINSFRCIFLSMLSVFTPCSNWSCLKLARTKSSPGKYASLTQAVCRLTGVHSATCVYDGPRAVLSHSLLLECPGPGQIWPCPRVQARWLYCRAAAGPGWHQCWIWQHRNKRAASPSREGWSTWLRQRMLEFIS